MSTIGKRIRKLRDLKRKTASELAESIGVPVSTYRDWEYGRSIRGDFYPPLSQALNVSLYELLTGKTPENIQLMVELEEIEKSVMSLKKNLGAFIL